MSFCQNAIRYNGAVSLNPIFNSDLMLDNDILK